MKAENKRLTITQVLNTPQVSTCYSAWVSVYDKLPRKRKPVLILTSYGKMATAYIVDKSHPDYGWTDLMRAQHGYGSVTHWMPLPKLPRKRAANRC